MIPASALAASGAVGQVLCIAIELYTFAVLGVIVLSWFPLASGGVMSTIWRFLRQITDPVLLPLRRLIPPIGGVLDVSPMIVFIVLALLRGRIC